MRMGDKILVPCTVVSVLTVRTSLSTRGRNLIRWKAWRFSCTVTSSSLPPQKKSQMAGSSDPRASCSYSNTFIGFIVLSQWNQFGVLLEIVPYKVQGGVDCCPKIY